LPLLTVARLAHYDFLLSLEPLIFCVTRPRELSLNIFVFEFVTGGGFLSGQQPPPSLLAEGRAMLWALVEDFCQVPEVNVTATCDQRFPLELPGCQMTEVATVEHCEAAFESLAARAEWTVVIAPEFDGWLEKFAGRVAAAGGRLLGPAPEFIAIAADKQQTADALRSAKVPVPDGVRLQPGMQLPDQFAYPAVLKRLDGAGSLDVSLISDAAAAVAHGPVPMAARLERFASGMATSVAVLCGPKSRQALSPCRQKISEDGRFVYQGGASPLDDDHVLRAQQLALDAIDCLPGALGYVGVDMVLGDDPAHDVVIEINPRLTVSYVGLRALYPNNLAQAMLALAVGERVELVPSTKRVDFDADGAVRCVEMNDSLA
jgi:predicted ATP-grasp superfamily ATP-dependent carboligase